MEPFPLTAAADENAASAVTTITNSAFMRQMLGLRTDEYSSLELRLASADASAGVQQQLQGLLGKDFLIENRYQQNKSLYSVMVTEKWAVYGILCLMLVVAAFTNEEGVRYQPDMMGSLVYAGGYPLAQALDSRGTDGTRLGDELARIGYDGAMDCGALVPHAFVELHIEQGPVMEAEGLEVGAVENLQGISWQAFEIIGQSNHAGTTPMHLRQIGRAHV